MRRVVVSACAAQQQSASLGRGARRTAPNTTPFTPSPSPRPPPGGTRGGARFSSSSASPGPLPPPGRGTLFTPAVLGGVAAAAAVSGAVLLRARLQDAADRRAVAALPLLAGNPVVFLEVADGDAPPLGRLVFQLRADAVPRTAENFRALAAGAPGWGFRASPLVRAEKGRRVFGGDFFGGGDGPGYSIYGDTFEDESFALRHAGPGTLAMRSRGPHSNASAFYVTLRALPELDGRCVVLGYLLEGWDVLDALDKAVDASSGRYKKGHNFRITNCGELKGYVRPPPGGSAGGEEAGSASRSSSAAPAPAAR